MSNHSPIPSPPPELVEEWRMDYIGRGHAFIDVATKAVQWGADQELEACAQWVDKLPGLFGSYDLRAARRTPPSLKEQALEAISRLRASVIHDDLKDDATIVRRALEALDG